MPVQTPVGCCARCDVLIDPGAPHFIYALHIVSGFDGVLKEPVEPISELINELLEDCNHASSEDLEDSVALSRVYTICPACRIVLLRDPLQRGSTGPTGLLS